MCSVECSILIEERLQSLEWLTEGLDMLNLVPAEETYVEDEICKRSDTSTELTSETIDRTKNLESDLEGLEDHKRIDGIDEEVDPTIEKPSTGLDMIINSADEKSANGVLANKDSVDGQQTSKIKDQLVLSDDNKSESDSGSVLPLFRSWLYEGSESSRYIQLLQRSYIIFNCNF